MTVPEGFANTADQLIVAQEEAQTLNRSFADHGDTPGPVKNALTVRPQIGARLSQARNLRRFRAG